MGRVIIQLPNTSPADGDYIYGRVKDDDGTNDGTPMNEQTMGDMWQFFARLMDLAAIAANGLPDNDYNGFQFFEALTAYIPKVFNYKNPFGANVPFFSQPVGTGGATLGFAASTAAYSVITDDDNILNPVTGEITPKAGLSKLSIELNVSSSATITFNVHVYKNGSLFKNIAGQTINSSETECISFANFPIIATGTDVYKVLIVASSPVTLSVSGFVTFEGVSNLVK